MAGHLPFDDIPPDREDGSSSWVHTALILTGRLGQVSPWQLLPAWVALALIGAWAWPGQRPAAGLLTGAFIAIDWLMLAGLPLTRRSWGPVTPSLLGLAVVHTGLSMIVGLSMDGAIGLGTLALTDLALSGMAVYATWVEPFRIQVSRQRLRVPGFPEGAKLTLLHISDIHYERLSRREEALLNLTEASEPDVIVLTGDYLNLSSVYDPVAQQGARALLARLSAPEGVYAVTGSPVVDHDTVVPAIFQGLQIEWLNDEAIALRLDSTFDQPVWLIGVRTTYDEVRDQATLRQLAAEVPEDALRILLYHTPDLAPNAAEQGIDLYLCGHTHGGQIRAPFYGAIATSSKYGKRYEQGRIAEGAMTLYVSRGLGLEGLGAPRARFLAPPEVILWEITN